MAGSDKMPPINGPIMKPRPKAAPIIPIRRDIILGSLMSPIYALATAILPLPAPDKNLAIIAIVILSERPKTMKNIELDIKPKINIGRRPYLSLNAPRIGVKINCAIE